jgi:hypothetical protein
LERKQEKRKQKQIKKKETKTQVDEVEAAKLGPVI